MKRSNVINYILISAFILSCDNGNDLDCITSIKLVPNLRYNYKFDDLQVEFSTPISDLSQYYIQCQLLNESNEILCYTDEINMESIPNVHAYTLSLWDFKWNEYDEDHSFYFPTVFYNIDNNNYFLKLVLKSISGHGMQCESNSVSIEINRENPDKSLVYNYWFIDYSGTEYELVNILRDFEYVFIFDYATWCIWSIRSIPQVNQIDSLYGDRVFVIGYPGDQIGKLSDEYIDQFKGAHNISFPIIETEILVPLTRAMNPDKTYSYPRFLLIDKKRSVKYRQEGYMDTMIDSIKYYINGL